MLITVKAPGKLFLVGEYAITFPYQSAVVFAVDKYVTVSAEQIVSPKINIRSDQLGTLTMSYDQLQADVSSDSWQLVKKTLQVLYQFHFKTLTAYQGITINIESDLTFQGKKLGLGSSAAVVVAIIKAFSQVFNLNLSKQEQFKLGVLTMLSLPNFAKGSMADVAIATYGNVLFYRKFDDTAIKQMLVDGLSYQTILNKDGPGLELQVLPWPSNWQIAVGWTGNPADTQKMLGKAVSSENLTLAKETLSLVTQPLISEFVLAVKASNFELMSKNLISNATGISNYTEQVGINYLTASLITAINISSNLNVPAKISGAGGGDNVIAITTNDEDKEKLHTAWQKNGITPLPLHIATLGE